MQVVMNYGRSGLNIDLPDDWKPEVIRKPSMPVLQDPELAVRQVLINPIGCNSLIDESKQCRSACISICDATRPVPNSLILPIILDQLIDSGISRDKITILIATGLHRPAHQSEFDELLGNADCYKGIQVISHIACNDHEHLDLGMTRRGTAVKVDRRFIESDLRIVIGLVEPHFMAGYSGGRKLITPGIAHHDTICQIHSPSLLLEPNVRNCVIDGNPLHNELMEIAGKVGDTRAVNVVLDEHRRISYVNYGCLDASHRSAVAFLKQYAEIPVARKFKTVITSAAGYPLDKTYYQTVKGMVAAADILEPGGDLFIVSECSEGIGSPEFISSQERLTDLGPHDFIESIRHKGMANIDEWQTLMQAKVMLIGNIHIYSDMLQESDYRHTGAIKVDSLMRDLQQSVEKSDDRRIAVIPEGPYIIPVLNS
ncbi:MAG: nickel-dependent lactate racemase family protein [Armatimonadota bacterium]